MTMAVFVDEASHSIAEQNPSKPTVSRVLENPEFPMKKAVSHRSTKSLEWTIQDSNL